MSLLKEIQHAAIDGSYDLESLLLKCRILATKLKHVELKNWVAFELDGYPPGMPLPDYRKCQGMCYGNFFGAFGRGVLNCPIHETDLPEAQREGMSHRHFREGVGALKSLVESAEGPSLKFGWPAEACRNLRPGNMAADLVLAQAWICVDKSKVVGILSTVRNRILNFALEIEISYPEAGEAAPGETPVPKEVLSQIFNQAVHGRKSSD
jgi:hypothetical protein